MRLKYSFVGKIDSFLRSHLLHLQVMVCNARQKVVGSLGIKNIPYIHTGPFNSKYFLHLIDSLRDFFGEAKSGLIVKRIHNSYCSLIGSTH